MMKKFILAGILSSSLLLSSLLNLPYGAKAQREGIIGVSGSPGTQQDCGSCHFVSKRVTYNALQSDIPEEGYLPNQIYNFTLHIRSQKQHAGFNIRPENNLGDAVGVITRIDTINTNISFNADEITHRNHLIQGGSKFIRFKWMAPAKGSGEVAFYAALGTGVVADTNGLFMDSLNLFHITYKEATISNLDPVVASNESLLEVTPTIVNESFVIAYQTPNGLPISMMIQNQEGKVLQDLSPLHGSAGMCVKHVDASNLPNGIYFVKLQAGHYEQTKKIIVSR